MPMNRSFAPVSSPVLGRESRIRRLRLSVAVGCLFACSEPPPPVVPNLPPRVCGTVRPVELVVAQGVLAHPCFEDPEGEELTLSASSSDAEVATVSTLDTNVRIKGIAPGSATITAVATDPHGLSASLDIEVTVLDPRPNNRRR